jgi:hypothetical protein
MGCDVPGLLGHLNFLVERPVFRLVE